VVVPLAAAIVLVACALAPRRVLVVGVPVLLVALGAAASVSASRFIADQARLVQSLTLGRDRTWIDDNADGPVTFLDAGQLNWETPWEARFWNKRLENAASFLGRTSPGGLPAPSVGPLGNGTLVADRTGMEIPGDYLVTSTFFDVDGTDLAHSAALVELWRPSKPMRLRSFLDRVTYNGVVPTGWARYYRYGCRGGTLHVTLSTSVPRNVELLANYTPLHIVRLRPGPAQSFDVVVPKPSDNETCYIDFRSDGPFVLQGVGWD